MSIRIFARTFAVFAFTFLSLSVQAEQLVYTDTVPLSTTNWNRTVTVPKFDPALGTLISVEIGFAGGVMGETRYENTDAAGTTITEQLSALISLLKPDLSIILDVHPMYQGVYQVPVFDGTIDFAGASGATHLDISATDNDAKGPYSDDNAFFTGAGTITFPVTASATSYVSGAGNLVSGFMTQAYASIIVTYNFDALPQCVPNQDGVSYENLTCAEPTTTILLDGSASSDAKSKGLGFVWSSNCPNGQFNDPQSITPTLTFDSFVNGEPTACTVTLVLTDSSDQQSSCQAAVSVAACTFDCQGELNGSARLDNCGVCNGDNACYECRDFNTTSSSFALDGNALAQFKNLKSAIKYRRKITSKPSFGANLIINGSAYYSEAWTLAWTLPELITTCANVQFCQSVSNLAFDAQFINNSDGLKDLTFTALKGFKGKSAAEKKRIKAYKTRANKLASENVTLLGTIPEQSLCQE